jgi:DNA-binding PadR family transcriptional regulator
VNDEPQDETIKSQIVGLLQKGYSRSQLINDFNFAERTGEEDYSAFQEATYDHPDAWPRRFYRLTREGIEASDIDWSNPLYVLYPEINGMPIDDYLKEKRREHKYRKPRRKERFLRPTTVGLFIRDYLLGLGPEGAPKIDPQQGDYPEHIFFHYKEMLRRAYARDAVALENEERQKKGFEPYSPEEYAERLEWHRERIPYKLHRARYQSFCKYFHYLKALEWVERTGQEEDSYIQENYPDAPPRVYYRLSQKGREAPDLEWFRPRITLYPQFDKEYFSQKNQDRRAKAPQINP